MKKYMQLADALKSKIEQGELAPGSRLPSIRAICQQYQFSKNTVIRALNELEDQMLVQAKTRQGFIALNDELAENNWFLGDRLLQPDITAVVGLSFARHIFPKLIADDEIPQLQNLTVRCETLTAFKASIID